MTLTTWSLASPAPIPARFEFKPFRLFTQDPVKALRRVLSNIQPFPGRVTIVASSAAGDMTHHLKFYSPESIVCIPHREHDSKSYGEVKRVWRQLKGAEPPVTASKRELLDLLDGATSEADERSEVAERPTVEEELVMSYLVSSIIDLSTDRDHARLENEKAERRLANLEAKSKLLEARVSWLTGELVHLKSESFLASIPSSTSAVPSEPLEPSLPEWTWI